MHSTSAMDMTSANQVGAARTSASSMSSSAASVRVSTEDSATQSLLSTNIRSHLLEVPAKERKDWLQEHVTSLSGEVASLRRDMEWVTATVRDLSNALKTLDEKVSVFIQKSWIVANHLEQQMTDLEGSKLCLMKLQLDELDKRQIHFDTIAKKMMDSKLGFERKAKKYHADFESMKCNNAKHSEVIDKLVRRVDKLEQYLTHSRTQWWEDQSYSAPDSWSKPRTNWQ